MVFKIKRKKPLTLKQLQEGIAMEKRKVKTAQEFQAKQIERSKLKSELFKLKHQKAIASAGKGSRLLRKAGRGIIKAGKKAAPVIIKQGKLIRQQQLRDDAIARSRKKTGTTTKTITKLVPIKGKKKLFKKVKIKVKTPGIKKETSTGLDLFKELDF